MSMTDRKQTNFKAWFLDSANVLIIAGAILLAVIIFCFGTRYQIVGTGEKDIGVSFRLDRITGKTWVCKGGICRPVEEKGLH
jgi:hypothetical protein